MAKYSTVPIINALSDKYHPTQILADLMTVHEILGPQPTSLSPYVAHTTHPSKTLPGLKVAWIGDGNNILHSMLVTFPKLNINLSVATPDNYKPDQQIVEIAKNEAEKTKSELTFTNDPKIAVKDADIIVTDTW